MKTIIKEAWSLGEAGHYLNQMEIASVIVSDSEVALNDYKNSNGFTTEKVLFLDRNQKFFFSGQWDDMYYVSR